MIGLCLDHSSPEFTTQVHPVGYEALVELWDERVKTRLTSGYQDLGGFPERVDYLTEVEGGFQVGSHDRLVLPLRVLQRWLPNVATRIVDCTAILQVTSMPMRRFFSSSILTAS